MSQVCRAFLVALALLVSASVTFAQTVSGDIPALIKIGQRISIEDDQGLTVEGRIDRISTGAIRVTRRGVSVDVPVDRVVRIIRPDGLGNGILIGLGVGAVIGTIGGALDPQGRGQRAKFVPVSAFGNGVICMGISAAIDAIHKGDRTVYQRTSPMKVDLAPVPGRGRRAVAVSFTW